MKSICSELLINLRNHDIGLRGELGLSVKNSFRMSSKDCENSKCLVGQAGSFLISALFWGVTQHQVVILYQRFGTTYWTDEARQPP
jgi:hypothetical protein